MTEWQNVFWCQFQVLDHSRSHNSNLKGPIYNTTYTNCFPYHYTGMGSLQYLICLTLRTCGLWWSRGLTWYRRVFYRASCPRDCYMKRSTLIMVLHTIIHFEGYRYLTLNPSLIHPPTLTGISVSSSLRMVKNTLQRCSWVPEYTTTSLSFWHSSLALLKNWWTSVMSSGYTSLSSVSEHIFTGTHS